MITKLSEIIAKWLVEETDTAMTNRDLIQYAVYSLFFGLLPILIVIVLGMFWGMVYEGIIMLVPYMLIRKFSGGYHIESPIICFLSSSGLLAAALALTTVIQNERITGIYTCVTFLAVVILCTLSPIDSEARRLTPREKQVFGSVARAIAITTYGIYLALVYLQSISNAVPIAMGINIAAFLQLPCLVGKQKNKKMHIQPQVGGKG